MPLYEIMCIATTRSSPTQLVNMLGKLAIVVKKGKGVFRRVENLGVRPLAHRMKAHMQYNEAGRFMRLYIQASPVLCADIEQRLRVDDVIIKTMTIKHKQAAPVVVQKKRTPEKILDSTSVTGILHHAPVLDWHVTDTLLRLGLMREDDVLALPRYVPDAGWEATRQEELLKRARGGNAAAAGVLQVPIPTREEDLLDIAKISKQEEAQMAAYEHYRAEDMERRRLERAEYAANEEKALQRRLAWYAGEKAAIVSRALAKRLNKQRKSYEPKLSPADAIEVAKVQEARREADRARNEEGRLLNERLRPPEERFGLLDPDMLDRLQEQKDRYRAVLEQREEERYNEMDVYVGAEIEAREKAGLPELTTAELSALQEAALEKVDTPARVARRQARSALPNLTDAELRSKAGLPATDEDKAAAAGVKDNKLGEMGAPTTPLQELKTFDADEDEREARAIRRWERAKAAEEAEEEEELAREMEEKEARLDKLAEERAKNPPVKGAVKQKDAEEDEDEDEDALEDADEDEDALDEEEDADENDELDADEEEDEHEIDAEEHDEDEEEGVDIKQDEDEDEDELDADANEDEDELDADKEEEEDDIYDVDADRDEAFDHDLNEDGSDAADKGEENEEEDVDEDEEEDQDQEENFDEDENDDLEGEDSEDAGQRIKHPPPAPKKQ